MNETDEPGNRPHEGEKSQPLPLPGRENPKPSNDLPPHLSWGLWIGLAAGFAGALIVGWLLQ